MQQLDFDSLRSALEGDAAAFRIVTDLDPAGGDADKVFPPTYQGGVYARETRIVDGQKLNCVLLDSVQSQANRLELALLEWHRASPRGRKPFPLVQIDFSGTDVAEVGLFSALEAPHRIADAVFLASLVTEDGREKPFRHPKNPQNESRIGAIVDQASPRNATGLFGLCPTALIFGMWDSHGARGGLGEKFQRVLVSEIIGVDATDDGRRPASRVDPLIKVAGESIKVTLQNDGTWTFDPKGKTKLAEVGLGNVTPSLEVPPNQKKNAESPYNHGGVSIRFARQICVLSLPALRRLQFPLDGKTDANLLARMTLAALALAAVARQWRSGFSLRSRCDLVPKGPMRIELIRPGSVEEFVLTPDSAAELAFRCARDASDAGLPWPPLRSEAPWGDGSLTLRPNEQLVRVIAESRRLAAEQRE
jgi:CRISPR-associated protein Csb1